MSNQLNIDDLLKKEVKVGAIDIVEQKDNPYVYDISIELNGVNITFKNVSGKHKSDPFNSAPEQHAYKRISVLMEYFGSFLCSLDMYGLKIDGVLKEKKE